MDAGRNSCVVILQGRMEGHGRHLGRMVLVVILSGVLVPLILLTQEGDVLGEGSGMRVDSVDGRRQAVFVRRREMMARGRWSGRKQMLPG